MNNVKFRFSDFFFSSVLNDTYLLFNTQSGKSVKISAECLEILEFAIKEGFTVDELLSKLADDEDRKYFFELIRILMENQILVEKSKIENIPIEAFTVELTYRCNLCCKHCSISANTLHAPEILSTDQLKTILSRVAELKPKAVVVTGGEPMARDDFYELIEYFKSISDANLGIMTNGTYISEENVEWLVKNFYSFDISLDGVDEQTCSIIRGKNVYNKVINAVQLLKKHNCERISLSMVDTATNHDKIEEFNQLNEKLGTTPVLRAFEPLGRGFDNKEMLSVDSKQSMSDSEMQKLAEEIGNEAIERLDGFCCGGGNSEFLINAKGDVFACAPMDMPEFCLGNALDDNFVDDMKNGQYRKKSCYKNLMKCMPYESAECGKCPYVMFCWSCMHEFYKAKKDPEYFKWRCNLKKKELRCMWGDIV